MAAGRRFGFKQLITLGFSNQQDEIRIILVLTS
jgi:hypothetical protein